MIKKRIITELTRYDENASNNKKGKINWMGIEGKDIEIEYNNKIHIFHICKYEKPSRLHFYIDNNIENVFEMSCGNFYLCKFKTCLGYKINEYKYKIGDILEVKSGKIEILEQIRICKNKNTNNTQKGYKYKCLNCSNVDIINETCLKNKVGCNVCGSISKKIIQGINDIYTTNPWMIPFIGEECAKTKTYGSHDKVQVTCPDCGRIKKSKIVDIYKYHSIGCSCSDRQSYVSKYMFNLLEQLKQQDKLNGFETEIKFEWCKFYNPFKKKYTYGIYDFVLENIKLIIETDGGFHRQDNNMSGQTKEESEWLDEKKDRLAKEHVYKVIRISDEGNIKQNILHNDRFNELFDLSNINWSRCEEFALSNLVKQACSLNRDNPDLTTTRIGEIMNLHQSTIIKYLKKGSKIWDWCHYDAKEEMIKQNSKNGISSGKPIEIFKNNISLGIFPSVLELERQSEILFGIKLKQSTISWALNKGKNHKGLTFQRTPKEEYKQWLEEQNKLKELHNQELGQAV